MPERKYQIAKQAPDRLDTDIRETVTYPDGKHAQVVLVLHPPASYTNAIATVEALQRAYSEGRGDREQELLQVPGEAGDWLLDAVRGRLLDAMNEWARGQLETPEGFYYLTLTNVDQVNGELYWEASEEDRMPGRKLRVRLLIEDVNKPRVNKTEAS